MITKELTDYIQQQLDQKVSWDVITSNLKQSGWADSDIHQAFSAVHVSTLTPPVNPNASLPSTTPTSTLSEEIKHPETLHPFLNPTPDHSSRKKKILLGLGILILILCTGGGAYAYYSGVFVSLPKLAIEAVDSAKVANSLTYDTTVSLDFSEIKNDIGGLDQILGGIGSKQFSITATGSYDGREALNTKASSIITLSGGAFSTELELRQVDNVFYGKLSKAPVLALVPFVSELEGKWFSFPIPEGMEMSQSPLASFGVGSTLGEKLDENQKNYIYNLSKNASFIKMVKRFNPEEISGEMSYHFAFDLDKEGIAAYLNSLKEYLNAIGKNDSALSAFDPTSYSESLENIKDFKGELWIGKKDKLLHKITISFGVSPEEEKPEQIKLNIVSIFRDWNAPIQIVAPEGSSSIEELMGMVVGNSLDEARDKGKEASIKSSLSSQRAYAELFYDSHSSYSGVCSSPDFVRTRGTIENSGGKNYSCSAIATQYVISAKLPNSSQYWCVDSFGSSKAINLPPSGNQCP